MLTCEQPCLKDLMDLPESPVVAFYRYHISRNRLRNKNILFSSFVFIMRLGANMHDADNSQFIPNIIIYANVYK